MFRYEKDMIPVLKQQLSLMFNTNYFLEEFNTGIGIADLVFTKNIEYHKSAINDYESISYAIDFINPKRGKKINISKIVIKNNLNKTKFNNLLKYLELNNHISFVDDENIKIHSIYKPSISEFYSIEAKLKDWKSGLYQALRYKNYSHRTYLAISSTYLRLVDLELFKQNNIGLISVSDNTIEVILKPSKEKPVNTIAQYYLSQNFVQKIEL